MDNRRDGQGRREQKLLDNAMREYPPCSRGRIWLMDRNYHGAARIARMMPSTHVLIRLKSDIPLKRTSEILADGSYRAELSGNGVTVAVRVIEYWVNVEGQQVPEMFCLVTDLMDRDEYPAAELAALYKWRWDGSETALREAKTSLRGAGPGTGRCSAPAPRAWSGRNSPPGPPPPGWPAASPSTPRSPPRPREREAAPGSRSGPGTCPFARAVRAVLPRSASGTPATRP